MDVLLLFRQYTAVEMLVIVSLDRREQTSPEGDIMEQLTFSVFEKEKSTDWKWTMADDYPKEKNGLKVFSCFACGGVAQWDIN